MKAKIIEIGNSKGIRIPKSLLSEIGLEDEVLLEATRGGIVIRPSHRPRQGWDDSFELMSTKGDDKLLIEHTKNLSSWDKEEWEWK